MEKNKVVLELTAEEAMATMDALLAYHVTLVNKKNHQASYIFGAHLDRLMFTIERIAETLYSAS